MDHRYKHKHLKAPTQSFLRLKIFEMYRDGFDSIEISAHLDMTEKNVTSHLKTYINSHNIDTEKLEKDRATLKSLSAALNRNKGKAVNNTSFKPKTSKPDIKLSLSEPQVVPSHQSWFSRCCSKAKSIILFWKSEAHA